jgi:hypothetical protein
VHVPRIVYGGQVTFKVKGNRNIQTNPGKSRGTELQSDRTSKNDTKLKDFDLGNSEKNQPHSRGSQNLRSTARGSHFFANVDNVTHNQPMSKDKSKTFDNGVKDTIRLKFDVYKNAKDPCGMKQDHDSLSTRNQKMIQEKTRKLAIKFRAMKTVDSSGKKTTRPGLEQSNAAVDASVQLRQSLNLQRKDIHLLRGNRKFKPIKEGADANIGEDQTSRGTVTDANRGSLASIESMLKPIVSIKTNEERKTNLSL